ncbi:oxygen-regulated protein 1-like isoform X4 [Stegostoma tigrinum]|uniref:oxygen-regulated protein 1-like isoform X4 n=1 Tax=Stegostoma tigrinum TaxID=3053191 RepID=UPI002870AA99|nr:oxygen-regulated protein 1-like isoform X4 [Stegostoma tigrinum]
MDEQQSSYDSLELAQIAKRVPKKLVIFRNGDPTFKRNLILNRNQIQNFDVLLNHVSELMNFPVLKLYSIDGKRIDSLYLVKYKLEAVVAAGREGYKLRKYADLKLPQMSNHDQFKNFKAEKNIRQGQGEDNGRLIQYLLLAQILNFTPHLLVNYT